MSTRAFDTRLLTALTGEPTRKKFAVYDLESKDGPGQRAGFTRPFLAGFFYRENGEDRYMQFRDRANLPLKWRRCRRCKTYTKGFDEHKLCRHKHAVTSVGQRLPCEPMGWEEYHIEPHNGCVDRLLRKFFTPKFHERVLYAHSGGTFDHLFVLTWLSRHRKLGFNFTVIPVQSTIQLIKVWRVVKGKKYTWTLLDSMRILPMALSKAAKAMGVQGKNDMDLHAHESDPLWEKYLRQDCVALYDVVEKFHDMVERKLGGEVGMTAPSTSMKLYRRRFLKKPIFRHAHFSECQHKSDGECFDCCHQWIRRAYYGGRTEILEMRGKNLKYYDINSSYVAAMLQPMPVGERIVQHGFIDWRLREHCIGFAEVEVQIPEDCIVPPLPYRSPSGKLTFHTGEFEGVYDVDELALLEHPMVKGKITKIGRVVWYRQAPAFKEMMETLWELRDKSLPEYDEGLSELAKLLGNSFYGKFGMDPDKEEIVFAKPSRKVHQYDETGQQMKAVMRTCWLCEKESLTKLCKACTGSKPCGRTSTTQAWFKKKRADAPYVIPQIAAHITTLARICLWKHMTTAYSKSLVTVSDYRKVDVMFRTVDADASSPAVKNEVARWHGTGFTARAEPGRVFNGDTDSIMTNVEIASSKKLGDMKDEYPGERLNGTFLQPKCYILEKPIPFEKEHESACEDKECKGCSNYKIAMKGLPKKQRTYPNLQALQRGETVVFSRLEKVRTMAGEAFRDPPKMVTVKKRIVGAYDKRVVLEDGVRTKAVVLTLDRSQTAE